MEGESWTDPLALLRQLRLPHGTKLLRFVTVAGRCVAALWEERVLWVTASPQRAPGNSDTVLAVPGTKAGCSRWFCVRKRINSGF